VYERITSGAGGAVTAKNLYDVIDQISVTTSRGVFGPDALRGSRMRTLEHTLRSWKAGARVQQSFGEASIAMSTANADRFLTIEIPYNLIGDREKDFARTVLSLQQAAARIVITPQAAISGNIASMAAVSTITVEALLGETKDLLAVPPVRFGTDGVTALTGAVMPGAMYRELLIERTDAVFAAGDIIQLTDLTLGKTQVVSQGIPERFASWQPARVAGTTAESFQDIPASGISSFQRIIPLDGRGHSVADAPVGTGKATLTTNAIPAANLLWNSCQIQPLLRGEIVAQITALGVPAEDVNACLDGKKGSFYNPGSRGMRPGKDLEGFLPVILNLG
jgi:hypothetical protein